MARSNRVAKKDSNLVPVKNFDSWVNVMTSLGMQGLDKKTGARPERKFLSIQEIEALYQSDPIAARIVDRPVEEMTREGFKLEVENDTDGKMEGFIREEFKRLSLDKKVEQGFKWSRIYGGAALIIGVDGGSNFEPTLPLEQGQVNEISFFLMLDRYRLVQVGLSMVADLKSPDWGKPAFYLIEADYETLQSRDKLVDSAKMIHYSRVIRFEGIELPWRLSLQQLGWGDSIFNRIFDVLRNYQTGHSSVATIIQDFIQTVWKMENLEDIVTQKGQAVILGKLALAQKLGSAINSIVIRTGEEMEKKTTNITGISDLIKVMKDDLVAATDMPHTVLLGEAAGGLGSTGDSEKKDWYDHIKNKQESELRPVLVKIIDWLFSQKKGITKGVIPKYEIEFCPLWQPSEKEEVETRKMQAETDEIYIRNQVLDPEEVSKNRFSENGYSHETTIDQDTRESIDLAQEEDVPPQTTAKPESVPPAQTPAPAPIVAPSNNVPPEAAANQTTSPQAALNGAQVTSLVEVIGQVAAQTLPRETGIEIIKVAFALSAEVAESIMGPVGKGFVPKSPEPVPSPFGNNSKPAATVPDNVPPPSTLSGDKPNDQTV